jgi:glycosyltransferase involved in cell wall biosynthesis
MEQMSRGERPTVVYVDHCAKLSGGELALLRTVRNSRLTQACVILTEHGPLEFELKNANVPTIVLAEPIETLDFEKPKRWALTNLAANGLRQVNIVRSLRHELQRVDPDLVVSNSMRAHFYVGLARRRASRWQHVAYVRDRISRDYLEPLQFLAASYVLKHRPDAIIANSLTTLQTVPIGYDRNLRVAIASPIDLPSDSGDHLPPSPAIYGMLSRISPWKGQELAIRAFARSFGGQQVKFEIAGAPLFGEGEYLSGLKALVQSLGLEDQVTLLGHVSDVYGLMSRWSAMIHASILPEPFGQVVLQGMAAGLAVIAPDEGGPAEIITDGDDGILFEPRSVESLAQRWKMLHDSPDSRQQIGLNASDSARRCSTPIIVNEIERFLLKVISSRSDSWIFSR